MNHSTDENINYDLLAKYLSGNASAEEKQQVEEWLAQSEANKQELEMIRLIWQIAPEEPVKKEVNVDAAWNKMQTRMQQLKLEEEEEEGTRESRFFTDEETSTQTGRVRRMNPWILRAVAMVVVIVAIWGITRFLFSSEPDMITVAAADQVQEVILPDGTIVTLNINSSLTYPEEFEAEQRLVSLTGEAFFEVEKNPEQPFIVNTGVVNVRVLGTKFNVSAFDTTNEVEVNVIEGKVLLYKEDNKGYVAEKVELTKGEKGVYSKAAGKIEELTTDPDAIYWQSKTLIFERTELTQVFMVLNNLFEIEITTENSNINNCRLSATFQNESFENILQVIATTFGLSVQKEGNTFKFTGEGC